MNKLLQQTNEKNKIMFKTRIEMEANKKKLQIKSQKCNKQIRNSLILIPFSMSVFEIFSSEKILVLEKQDFFF